MRVLKHEYFGAAQVYSLLRVTLNNTFAYSRLSVSLRVVMRSGDFSLPQDAQCILQAPAR